jgi:hypothetical protein
LAPRPSNVPSIGSILNFSRDQKIRSQPGMTA